MKTTRIDNYLCLDVERIVVDEMKVILETKSSMFAHEEDRVMWDELTAAAKVILENYDC